MVNKRISFKKAGTKKSKTLKHVEGKGKVIKDRFTYTQSMIDLPPTPLALRYVNSLNLSG